MTDLYDFSSSSVIRGNSANVSDFNCSNLSRTSSKGYCNANESVSANKRGVLYIFSALLIVESNTNLAPPVIEEPHSYLYNWPLSAF